MRLTFPFLADSEAQLEELVLATKENGGSFIFGGVYGKHGIEWEPNLSSGRSIRGTVWLQ